MAEQRFVKYGDRTMPMPDGMTLDQAKAVMARHFPELAENPKVENKKDGDETTYVFSKQAGRKGVSAVRRITKKLDALPPTTIVAAPLVDFVFGKTNHIGAHFHEMLNAEIAGVISARETLVTLTPTLHADANEVDLL